MAHNNAAELVSKTQQYFHDSNAHHRDSATPKSQKSDASLNSALHRYFHKEGEARLLQEQLGDLDDGTTQEKVQGQGSAELLWDNEEQHDLLEKLRTVQEELSVLRLEAEQRGLDIERVRWRDRAPIFGEFATSRPSEQAQPVQNWLQQVDDQGPPPGVLHASDSRPLAAPAQSYWSTIPGPQRVPAESLPYTAGHFAEHTPPHTMDPYSYPRHDNSIWPYVTIPRPQQQFNSPRQPFERPTMSAKPQYYPYENVPILTESKALSAGAPSLKSSHWDSPESTAVGSSDQVTSLSHGFKSRRTLIKPDGKTELKYKGRSPYFDPQCILLTVRQNTNSGEDRENFSKWAR